MAPGGRRGSGAALLVGLLAGPGAVRGQPKGCVWNDCDLEQRLTPLVQNCTAHGADGCDAACQARGGVVPGCLYHRCATLVGGQELLVFVQHDSAEYAIFRQHWKNLAATLRVEHWDYALQRSAELRVPAGELGGVEGGALLRFSSTPPQSTRGDTKYKRVDSFYLHLGGAANQLVARRPLLDPTLKLDPSGPPPSPETAEEWLLLQGLPDSYPGKLLLASELYGLGDGFALVGGLEQLRGQCSACKMAKSCKGDVTDNPLLYALTVAIALALLAGCACFVYTGACWKCWLCCESCFPKTFEYNDDGPDQRELSRRAQENHVRVMVFEHQRRQ